MSVRVEDAATEEITEHDGERLAFGVVGEIGAEDVFDIGRIGGDDGATSAEAGESDGVRWRGGE